MSFFENSENLTTIINGDDESVSSSSSSSAIIEPNIGIDTLAQKLELNTKQIETKGFSDEELSKEGFINSEIIIQTTLKNKDLKQDWLKNVEYDQDSYQRAQNQEFSKFTKKPIELSTTTPPIMNNSPKLNARNLTGALIFSWNAIKPTPAIQDAIKTSTRKSIIKSTLTTFAQNLSTMPENTTVSTTTITDRTIFTVNLKDFGESRINFVRPNCTCPPSTPPPDSISLPAFDDYTNIWKLSFFVLAFVIGFVSLIVIISFILRYFIAYLKKVNLFGVHSYKLHGKKASQCSKVSSISLFDNESDKYSTSDKDTTKKSKKTSKASKLRYKLSIKSKTKKEPKKPKRKTKSTNKVSKDTSDPNLFSNKQPRTYGVTNKAFFDTHRPVEAPKQHKDYMIPFEVSNGILSSFSKRNSHTTSFRPFDTPGPTESSTRPTSSLTDLNFTSSLPDIDLTQTNKTLEVVSKVEECPTYQHAWKQCNDYEALETTNGSITNLSSVTTSFEQMNNTNKQLSTFQAQSYHCNLEKRNSNNNELISRSAKITEELEIKLKERRMMMESKSDELLQHQHQLHLQHAHLNHDSSGPHSCGCPCHGSHTHHHNHSHGNNSSQNSGAHVSTKIERIQSRSTENEKLHHHRQMLPPGSSGIITVPIERAYSTPNKRESIRKLIQNKAVSENKQKGELEKHLTSLLCTRANPYEMNE